MIERHYDEEALVTMLDSGAHASDPHLETCGECSEKFHSFGLVTRVLRDAATWAKRNVADAPNPNTIATLRAFATNMAAEDAAAEAFVADLLAGPRDGWMRKLAAHPEYRTAGLVRRLIARVPRALDTVPADALELTRVATAAAEHLEGDTGAKLRSAAWRERAYALFYVGRYAEAASAIAFADASLAPVVVDEFDRARLGVVRALIDRMLERVPSAFESVKASAKTFMEFGDLPRSAAATIAQAHILYDLQKFDAAYESLLALERRLREGDDADTHARVLANLGHCCARLGRTDEALRHHEAAAMLMEELGVETEAVRERWAVAQILAGEGRVDAALERLRATRVDFERRGMIMPAALVGLHIAELLLARGEFSEPERICHAAMVSFETAGVLHTSQALTALAFLHEATRMRRATPELVRHVGDYLRRVPKDGALLFAPPPL